MPKGTHHWLIKSEPETYGIEHLKKDKKTPWTGVRNFQARNYMQKEMHLGDAVLFYHSSCAVPGVYGLARVASCAYPDPTQFDPTSDYYDKRASKEKPLWYMVDVAFVKKLKEPITLKHIRERKELRTMKLLQPGSRLSVSPVTTQEYELLFS